MTREKAVDAANLLYKLENIDNFLDEQCEQVSGQEDSELIAMMNDMQVHVLEYKKRLEEELEKL